MRPADYSVNAVVSRNARPDAYGLNPGGSWAATATRFIGPGWTSLRPSAKPRCAPDCPKVPWRFCAP